MTPKQKAEELVNKHLTLLEPELIKHFYFSYVKHLAIQCALIAVEEILEVLEYANGDWQNDDAIEYYKQVKEELIKYNK